MFGGLYFCYPFRIHIFLGTRLAKLRDLTESLRSVLVSSQFDTASPSYDLSNFSPTAIQNRSRVLHIRQARESLEVQIDLCRAVVFRTLKLYLVSVGGRLYCVLPKYNRIS